MSSPTQRTKKLLADRGYLTSVVERWNSFARVRQDLFGIIDVVAIKADAKGVLGVQTTSYSNLSARMKKAKAEPNLRVWLEAGNGFELHGWRKVKNRWQAEVRTLEANDIATGEAA